MGIKRDLLECAVKFGALLAPGDAQIPQDPASILVFRNNDIGDLLVITPLFEALKRKFPRAKIVAGIGSWNFEVLKNNPFIDELLPVDAPWHNQQVHPHGLLAALKYLCSSDQIKTLRHHKFDIGIDVLGSPFGSLLLMHAGIPFRLGVKGYAGGHSGTQQYLLFNQDEQVGRSALRFAELLGAVDLPENRPQIYLDETPVQSDQIIIAPGGGFSEKCWPIEYYEELVQRLSGFKISVIGSQREIAHGEKLAAVGAHVTDLTGKLSLSETFKLIASSRLVICNSSMAMHAAAAFRKPCYVLLGSFYSSTSLHSSQWGYPETIILGKDENRQEIFTPIEVFEKFVSC